MFFGCVLVIIPWVLRSGGFQEYGVAMVPLAREYRGCHGS